MKLLIDLGKRMVQMFSHLVVQTTSVWLTTTHTSYFEIDRLETKTAKEITKILRKLFSVHGIPNQLISDNMPFSSQEFREFRASYEFVVITSSPGYPQSTGKVENTIKTAKSIMKKAKQAGTDIYLSLLDWRNTPSEGMSSSPALACLDAEQEHCSPPLVTC